MCLADLFLIFEHWRLHPPVEDLVAAFVGFKPSSAPSTPENGAPSADIVKLREFAAQHLKSGGKMREAGAI